eukprot:6181492-Pleurochrysis_carterae.AAC.3
MDIGLRAPAELAAGRTNVAAETRAPKQSFTAPMGHQPAQMEPAQKNKLSQLKHMHCCSHRGCPYLPNTCPMPDTIIGK